MSPTITMNRAPSCTHAERMRRLQRANEIRVYRAQLKREIAAGQVDVAGLLRDVPRDLESMRVADLLMAVPSLGAVKVRKMLNRAGNVSPTRRLSSLTERQRLELAAKVPVNRAPQSAELAQQEVSDA